MAISIPNKISEIYCSAKVYQDKKKVAILKNVTIRLSIPPVFPAPLSQPQATCYVYGEIEKVSGLIVANMVTIKFETNTGEKLNGDFYFRPPSIFEKENFVYLDLSGALIKE